MTVSITTNKTLLAFDKCSNESTKKVSVHTLHPHVSCFKTDEPANCTYMRQSGEKRVLLLAIDHI